MLASEEQEEPSIDLIYLKIVNLEEEIASLRALIEENAYLIDRSQQLQKQRYIDLDKRLQTLSSDNSNVSSRSLSNKKDELLNLLESKGLEDELIYLNALKLFDDSRFAEALEKFQELIVNFPSSEYVPDAYFWSGELFLFQKKLDDARENYLVLITDYMNHPRSADSLYKLGEIARNSSDNSNAKEYFLNVLEKFPDTGAAELAKKSLNIIEESSNSIE